MIVTINTDASYNHQHKVGGYAYWIVYNGERTKTGGVLKESTSAVEAEIKAIANALYRLIKLKYKNVSLIIVNTDSTPAIERITGTRESKNEEINKTVTAINEYLNELRLYNNVGKSNMEYVEFRHVKAHTKAKDKRSYVNDWCDKIAKDFVKKHILKLCQKKNSQPDRG